MADETLNANDGTLNVRAGSLGGTSMRYHELALQRWLNQLFYVREGYPVPVVFTSPMDAFSYFQQLWSDTNNPFAYLFDLKDSRGTPLYEPHPSPVRYPILSVYRKGWKIRPYQNFSIHRWRHINWPTVANAGTERYGPQAQGWDITKCQLGNVTTSRMPMAWNYRFQIDHFCNRPDTQAFFIEQLMQEFWRTGGVEPQTWITVPYPGWGNRRVRLYLDGDIENLTPEEPEDGKNIEFRTSFTVVVEGFDVDLRYEIYPALWNLVFRFGPVAPIELEACFNFTKTVDVRVDGSNSSIDIRPNVPMSGTCQEAIWDAGANQTFIEVVGLNETANNHFGVFTIGTTAAAIFSVFGTDYAGLSTLVNGVAFLEGTLAETGTVAIEVSGTDGAAQTVAFVYGGNDIFPFKQFSVNAVALASGSIMDASVPGGSPVENGTNFIAFNVGTLADTIVSVFGTDYGTNTVLLFGGSLTDVVISAGTWYAPSIYTIAFANGTLATLIIDAGTRFGETTSTVSFLDGTLA